jgi:hypothetical protein
MSGVVQTIQFKAARNIMVLQLIIVWLFWLRWGMTPYRYVHPLRPARKTLKFRPYNQIRTSTFRRLFFFFGFILQSNWCQDVKSVSRHLAHDACSKLVKENFTPVKSVQMLRVKGQQLPRVYLPDLSLPHRKIDCPYGFSNTRLSNTSWILLQWCQCGWPFVLSWFRARCAERSIRWLFCVHAYDNLYKSCSAGRRYRWRLLQSYTCCP